MNHEKTTVYPSEDERMYRIPNQEVGLGTNDNLIGRLKEGEYDPKQEYMLTDSESTPYYASLTGLIELNEHETVDDHNRDTHDRLIQVAITRRVKVGKDGQPYNARGTKWVPVGSVIDSAYINLTDGERKRAAARTVEIGSTAIASMDIRDKMTH